jgi:hypothetical protein
MQKKKEKQHARGKAMCREEDKPIHIRIRVFDKDCNDYNIVK